MSEAIKRAAVIAKQLLELRAEQTDELRVARAQGHSFEVISRGIASELGRLGCTPEQICATGTGPGNIRKRLAA